MSDDPSVPFARRAWPVSKQVRGVLILTLTVGIALAVAAGLTQRAARALASQSPAAPERAAHLRLTAAQRATLEVVPVATLSFRTERTAEGRIALNGDTTTQVFSPYSGRVVRVLAALGARVQAGTPLLAIEASEFVQGASDLRNAVSQLKLARLNEQRKRGAYDAKGGSLADWQQAQADLAAAETTLQAARDRLRILGRTPAEIDTLAASGAREPVAYVTAPIAGVVTDRQVGPGQYIQAGSTTPVYTIGDLSTVWLVADVREDDAPAIERGQQVEVHVLALPGKVFEATVTELGATVDPITHRVPVRARLANTDGKLKPEMFASFSIVTSPAVSSTAVPEEAVVREGDEARVWIVEDGNGLSLRQIRIGRVSGGMVEVLEGLRPGEQVVTRGSVFIDRAAQPG
jgi:cobalt-zinc-cadmium efflux system membrane fusion protein